MITNVWISGIVFSGLPSKIVRLAFEKKFVVVISSAIIRELERVLAEKFDVPAKDIKRLNYRITQIADIFEPPGELKAVPGDPDDDLILETAITGNARYLVSGDKKHLLPLKSHSGVLIVEPREFLRHIQN